MVSGVWCELIGGWCVCGWAWRGRVVCCDVLGAWCLVWLPRRVRGVCCGLVTDVGGGAASRFRRSPCFRVAVND